MNPHQFMHQHLILDGLERFSKIIPQNVNICKSKLHGVEKHEGGGGIQWHC